MWVYTRYVAKAFHRCYPLCSANYETVGGSGREQARRKSSDASHQLYNLIIIITRYLVISLWLLIIENSSNAWIGTSSAPFTHTHTARDAPRYIPLRAVSYTHLVHTFNTYII